MASVNKPVGLSCGVWKMFEKKTRCHKRCLGGQQCWKGAHKTPLDPFWTPLSLLNPSLVPRPTWDIHVSRGTRLPQSPQWSPNEHHQVAPSDHPSHPIYKPSSCLIMYWHSQNCHRNLKKLRYSFYNSDRSSIYVMMLILLAVSKIHNWPVIIQQHTHYNFWWFWPQKVHDWMCSCIYIVC